jgi:hypothetical protein
MGKTIEEHLREREERSLHDAGRLRGLDEAECQLCYARGPDKRSLFIGCFYAIHEVIPEAIDLSAVPEWEQRGYYVRLCKWCRGELLQRLGEWRNFCVARRPLEKDHDGEAIYQPAAANVPVRINGRIAWMTPADYAAWQEEQGR